MIIQKIIEVLVEKVKIYKDSIHYSWVIELRCDNYLIGGVLGLYP